MKIVLDSNVLISAFVARGLCQELLEICVSEHQLVLSEHILSEVTANLTAKIGLPRTLTETIAGYLRLQAEIVAPASVPASVCRDRDDLPVIGTAVAADAEVVVSGDNDLTSIGEDASIKVLSPRSFWEYLASR